MLCVCTQFSFYVLLTYNKRNRYITTYFFVFAMEADLKERLIQLVRSHECLYNPKHEQYKNKNYKLLLWERIGTKLEIDGNKAKEIWRSMRDGYVRYKKHKTIKAGSTRKYCQYTWSSQMTFLDDSIEFRPKATITPLEQSKTEITESRLSQSVSPLPRQPSLSPQPGYSRADTPPDPWQIETIQLPSTQLENFPSPKKKNQSTDYSMEDTVEKVLECLQNRGRNNEQYDEVDHLFASYAKTFKKLRRRTQAELKLTLAKAFADAELKEIDRENIKIECTESDSVYASSTYE